MVNLAGFFNEMDSFKQSISTMRSSGFFKRIYEDVGVNLKFLKEKSEGSDPDVSTVLLRVFLSRTFPFILLTSSIINS